MNIYCTADEIGAKSGGGIVTYYEYTAFNQLHGQVIPLDSLQIGRRENPFEYDELVLSLLQKKNEPVQFAHFYAGTFSKTIAYLKASGTKVTYTAAAHNIDDSRAEHHTMAVAFDYPHLNTQDLWQQYLQGYLLADTVICPSHYSAKIMQGYGCKNVIVIPHGATVPAVVKPRPTRYRVGYLGVCGPDKGLIYLIQAWKKLNLNNASLVLAGRNTVAFLPYIRRFGGGNVELKGFVTYPRELYDYCSVYCQPAVTEGFGIEVPEALAHGRPVLVSTGAGAVDCVSPETGMSFEKRNANDLAEKLLLMFSKEYDPQTLSDIVSKRWSWDYVKNRYINFWASIK